MELDTLKAENWSGCITGSMNYMYLHHSPFWSASYAGAYRIRARPQSWASIAHLYIYRYIVCSTLSPPSPLLSSPLLSFPLLSFLECCLEPALDRPIDIKVYTPTALCGNYIYISHSLIHALIAAPGFDSGVVP